MNKIVTIFYNGGKCIWLVSETTSQMSFGGGWGEGVNIFESVGGNYKPKVIPSPRERD